MPNLIFDKASVFYPSHAPIAAGEQRGIGARIIKRGHRHSIASLDKINLTLKSGDRVGIIGQNGSGKSTLLRLGSGILRPNEGDVIINGRVATLFTTTIGMNMDASAIKNIRDAADLMSIPRKLINDTLADVIDFSEIGAFANQPMRTYSSGMRARVGFGLATSFDTDILLIDEVFGTGDMQFYKKARKRLEDKIGQASILMLASHSDRIISTFCEKALWLHQGKIRDFGSIDSICKDYRKFMST
ncbi:ABC transporter ATP-binding protein [Robiginitomaculum antarcticum]|uniref:ABC transporter ATP-binding protein n=1 Tax=Robiginitomaculum antarcticum TaxID=437507 RepID=UPI000373FBCD|nr:ABC transporter ATP-binding protein [Robiginitomaculum antarcticum]